MRSTTLFVAGLKTLFFSTLVGATVSHPHQHDHHHRKRHCHIGKCDFHPSESPKCWGDHSLETNFYNEIPDTGVTREYWLEIQNGTAAVDGVERMVLTVNGSVPGPTIMADWGDMLVIHVHNALQDNGTSLHWHGLRQNYTTQQDGVASITQCPVAPGDTITYRFRAEQYGHTWYHSHFALQAWNGVFGGILINGPASAPYDDDKGVLMLSDWFHNTTDALWSTAITGQPPVEAADQLPVVVVVGGGQETNATATATTTDFWMRAWPDMACSAENEMRDNIRGIVRYDAASTATPTTTAYAYTEDCLDEPMASLVPYMALDAAAPDSSSSTTTSSSTSKAFDVGYAIEDGGVFKWTLDGQDIQSDWGVPTLRQSMLHDDITTKLFAEAENVVEITNENGWVYFVIENGAAALGLSHPIHLHGHDFYVLAQEAGANYTAGVTPLQLRNPPRRDVAMLPADGFLVIAFVADNPGVWLMHCHIGWHASQGFGLQVVERRAEIPPLCDASSLDSTCSKWNRYVEAKGVVQDDSGI
ncbi:putative multicopper oxidase [Xylariomycetidae sp. FL2044]|nr:putative multicopper oxidase [Xylariomycetidae sp. FL2044]